MHQTDLNDLYVGLGQRIRKIRKERGLKQTELANQCDIEPSNLNRIEMGRTNPTIRTLTLIANALNISLQTLFRGL